MYAPISFYMPYTAGALVNKLLPALSLSVAFFFSPISPLSIFTKAAAPQRSCEEDVTQHIRSLHHQTVIDYLHGAQTTELAHRTLDAFAPALLHESVLCENPRTTDFKATLFSVGYVLRTQRFLKPACIDALLFGGLTATGATHGARWEGTDKQNAQIKGALFHYALVGVPLVLLREVEAHTAQTASFYERIGTNRIPSLIQETKPGHIRMTSNFAQQYVAFSMIYQLHTELLAASALLATLLTSADELSRRSNDTASLDTFDPFFSVLSMCIANGESPSSTEALRLATHAVSEFILFATKKPYILTEALTQGYGISYPAQRTNYSCEKLWDTQTSPKKSYTPALSIENAARLTNLSLSDVVTVNQALTTLKTTLSEIAQLPFHTPADAHALLEHMRADAQLPAALAALKSLYFSKALGENSQSAFARTIVTMIDTITPALEAPAHGALDAENALLTPPSIAPSLTAFAR